MNIFGLPEVQQLIELALREDIGSGDVTSLATVPPEARLQALFVAREALTVSGLELIREVYAKLSSEMTCTLLKDSGDRVTSGTALARIEGPARVVLTGERVSLNFIQRLCGIATLTSAYLDAVSGIPVKILDTRKTTPGWRALEKHAVTCGGGTNHRYGLHDMVLIKDNHLAALRGASPNAIAAAVGRARQAYPSLKIEVEADTLEQVREAVGAGADVILLDNMSLEQLREAVGIVGGRCQTEASGGVNLETVREIASAGVDSISIGALTHSARCVDIGLDYQENQ